LNEIGEFTHAQNASSSSRIIRDFIPDKNGKTLPADLASGSYEVRDLTNHAFGTLFEAKVIYDKTYGHVTYGCNQCCGYTTPVTLWYNPVLVPFTSTADDGVFAYEPCMAGYDDVSSYFYSHWNSNDTSIVTVDAIGTHYGVAVGSTTSFVSAAPLPNSNIRLNCPNSMMGPSQGGANVTPNVTIGSFSQNPILKGATGTVQVTVDPSASITLNIISNGTGAAAFNGSGGPTSLTISGTTTVTIYGSAASTDSGDLTLSASYSGHVVAYALFSITSGACTVIGEHASGSGVKQCPSTVTLQSQFTINQWCPSCSYSCVVHTDGTWSPVSCDTGNGSHIAGSLTGTITATATGTFAASDCNFHNSFFTLTVINAQGTSTPVDGASIGLKCTSFPNGSPCP
jgi:hypothetical protein